MMFNLFLLDSLFATMCHSFPFGDVCRKAPNLLQVRKSLRNFIGVFRG